MDKTMRKGVRNGALAARLAKRNPCKCFPTSYFLSAAAHLSTLSEGGGPRVLSSCAHVAGAGAGRRAKSAKRRRAKRRAAAAAASSASCMQAQCQILPRPVLIPSNLGLEFNKTSQQAWGLE
jgi:hypothetical protein